ncbi:hypothetical protein QT352_12085 [Escherichia coli]|nr:hypothetical protein [Escherichia coli]
MDSLATSVSGKNVVLTNAMNSQVLVMHNGNAEISGRFMEQTNEDYIL